jgi:hypothetical protein
MAMASISSRLLLSGAAITATGRALVTDVGLDEHPTHGARPGTDGASALSLNETRRSMAAPTEAGEHLTPSESAQYSPNAMATASPQAVGTRHRTVTTSQVTRAITELRQQRGHAATVQIQAVIRAFDLTIVPDPEVPTSRPDGRLVSGPCVACLTSLGGPNQPRGHTCW